MHELLGLIKDGKAPKKIKYINLIWTLNEDVQDYDDTERYLFKDFMADSDNNRSFLNDVLEILEEENKDFEDMEEIEYETVCEQNILDPLNPKKYYRFDESEMLIEVNKLIRNQKKIIKMVKNRAFIFESIDELNEYINERLEEDE